MKHPTNILLALLAAGLVLAACAPNAPLPGPTPIPTRSGPSPTLDPRLSAANIPVVAQPGDAAAGRALFAQSCTACHGQEGVGLSAPSLVASAFVKGASEEQIFDTIAKGRLEKGMPAWSSATGGLYSDSQIRNLVAYVRELAK